MKTQGSCTAVLLTGEQAPHKVVFKVTGTRGYLILGCEAVQQIGYMHFPRITPPLLTQALKIHALLRAITVKAPKQKETSRTDQDLRHQNIQLLDGAVLINGKKDNLPITKEYMLKEYNDVLSGIGIPPGNGYHIKLMKDNEPVQH